MKTDAFEPDSRVGDMTGTNDLSGQSDFSVGQGTQRMSLGRHAQWAVEKMQISDD
jgi:hypothetical protein